MEIICPSCNASYNIPEKKFPSSKAVAQCKKCGGNITIDSGKVASSNGAGVTPTGLQPDTPKSPPVPPAEPRLREIFEAYPELQALAGEKFDLTAILTPTKKGSYKTRRNKFKVRILKAVFDKANRIFNDGEKVMRNLSPQGQTPGLHRCKKVFDKRNATVYRRNEKCFTRDRSAEHISRKAVSSLLYSAGR
jgi:predicted Zn finger-like uncharacterized protein